MIRCRFAAGSVRLSSAGEVFCSGSFSSPANGTCMWKMAAVLKKIHGY